MSSADDILDEWAKERPNQRPSYTIKSEDGLTFTCILKVPGISKQVRRNSSTAKGARSMAAEEFCKFLVRKGQMLKEVLEAITARSTEEERGRDTVGGEEGSNGGRDEIVEEIAVNEVQKDEDNALDVGSSKTIDSANDSGVKEVEKPTFAIQSEFAQPKKTKTGGWNKKNSQKALDEYLQRTQQSPPRYKTVRAKKGTANHFDSSFSLFVPEIGKDVTAHGNGRTPEAAEANSVMSMFRNLYRMDVLEAFPASGGGENADGKNSASTEDRTGYGGWNEENSKETLNEYLQKMGLPPAVYTTSEQTMLDNFFSTVYIFVPGRGIEGGEASGKSEEEAERRCAAALVQKLDQTNILEGFREATERYDEEDSINLESLMETLGIAPYGGDSDTYNESLSVEAPSEKTRTGGWNEANSQIALNVWLWEKGIPPAVYKTEKAIGNDGKIMYKSSLSLFIPEIGREVTARGCDSYKKRKSRANCAMMMARQLYQMGVFEKFEKKGALVESTGTHW